MFVVAGLSDIGVQLFCWLAAPDVSAVYSPNYTPAAACAPVNITSAQNMQGCAAAGAPLVGSGTPVHVVGNTAIISGSGVSVRMLAGGAGDVGVAWFEPTVMPTHDVVVSGRVMATAAGGDFCGSLAVVLANGDSWASSFVVVELTTPVTGGTASTDVRVYTESGPSAGAGTAFVTLAASAFGGASPAFEVRILVCAAPGCGGDAM